MWFKENMANKNRKQNSIFESFESFWTKLKEKDRQLLNKPLSFDLKMDFFLCSWSKKALLSCCCWGGKMTSQILSNCRSVSADSLPIIHCRSSLPKRFWLLLGCSRLVEWNTILLTPVNRWLYDCLFSCCRNS